MRNATTIALLFALTACGGCESTDPVPVVEPQGNERVEIQTAPVATTKFKVGDKVVMMLPEDMTLNGTIVEVGPIIDTKDFDGTPRPKTQMYIVDVVINEVGPDGTPINMVIRGPAPEFILGFQPNGKK